jgi:hypothetical protein
MGLSIFPWQNGEKPDFINEEGFEWYVDKELTKYGREQRDKLKPLKAICFYVTKEGKLLSRVLIDENQNVLHDDATLEGMAAKIDFLRLVNSV